VCLPETNSASPSTVYSAVGITERRQAVLPAGQRANLNTLHDTLDLFIAIGLIQNEILAESSKHFSALHLQNVLDSRNFWNDVDFDFRSGLHSDVLSHSLSTLHSGLEAQTSTNGEFADVRTDEAGIVEKDRAFDESVRVTADFGDFSGARFGARWRFILAGILHHLEVAEILIEFWKSGDSNVFRHFLRAIHAGGEGQTSADRKLTDVRSNEA